MNKNLVVGGIVLLLVIAGAVYFSRNPANTDVVSNTEDTTGNSGNTNTENTGGTSKATAPAVVTSSSVSPSDTTAVVNGTVNPKGSFTNYWYEYGNSVNLGNKTASQNIGSGFVAISAPGYITNLVKNTTYYFRLVAENGQGKVVGDQFTFKTTEGNPPPVGSAPTVKTTGATAIARTTAKINGEVTPNKADTQYWFEFGKTAQLGSISAFSSVDSENGKTSASVTLADLEPLTTYYFRLNAQNQFGTVNGTILNFKTSGPSDAKAPGVTTGSADTIDTDSAVLHGTVTPNLSETRYWFEYNTATLLGSIIGKSTEPVVVGSGQGPVPIDKMVSGLQSNTTYYFRIVAQNAKGTTRGEEHTFKTK